MLARRRAAGLALAATAALLATACGTRLPDSAFTAAGQGGEQQGPSSLGTGSPAQPGQAEVPGGSAGATGAGGGAAPGAAGQPATGSAAGHGHAGGKAAAHNTASDVGVTATTIRVGNISSISNPFDPLAFAGPVLGAKAYFQWLDSHGGVNGRVVQFFSCDDRANTARNQTCVRNLIDTTKVFAFAGNAIFDYAGADYVQQKGVPDVGGQPIDDAYNADSHLFSIYGVPYPRNGKVGYNGTLYGGTENYRFFKTKYPNVPKKAGVVYYNQAASQSFGQYIAQGLKTEGFDVVQEQVDFALPDFNSAVIAMKSKGVQYVFDVLDVGGNQSLCQAMDQNQLYVKAKVTTTQGWTANVKQGYAKSPKCRNSLYAIGNTANYEDTSNPQVAAFRAAVKQYGYDGPNQLSDWELEGWAAAQWLTDAIRSCGAGVTRKCVEAYLDRHAEYDGHGLLTPRDFIVQDPPPKTVDNCINVVRWQDSAYGGRGGWVDVVPDMDKNCFTVPNIPYQP